MKLIQYVLLLIMTMSNVYAKNSGTHVLNITLPKLRMEGLDPAKIVYSHQYIFLENIYRTIVEMDGNGKILPGLAHSYRWNNNDLIFSFRNDQFTKDGYRITAEDAAFSIKRLLILASNTHGDIKDALCPGKTISKIRDNCEGIVATKDNKLILRIKGSKTFIIPMLTSIDFAVIPIPSVDMKSLEIKEFNNTSGVWYVDSLTPEKIYLKANRSSYHYSESIAQEIHIDQTENEFELFQKGKVDLIPTINRLDSNEFALLAKTVEKSQLHRTFDIKAIFGVFTEKGEKSLSKGQRLALGNLVRSSYSEYLAEQNLSQRSTIKLFPPFGEGDITVEEKMNIEKMYCDNPSTALKKSVKIGLLNTFGWEEKLKPTLSRNIKNSELKMIHSIPTIDNSGRFDFFLVAADVGFFEDISLLSHYMSVGYFEADREKGQAFISRYSSIEDKGRRIAMLKDLHFQVLSEPKIIPIVRQPYYAISRNGWKTNFSKYFANCPLWLVSR